MTASRVALFPTCVVDTVAPQVGVSAVRVLRRAGYEVSVPRDATCCGQPAWNVGLAEEAATVARTTLRALTDEASDVVCVPAGSCATMIRVTWPELFSIVGDPHARRLSEELGSRVKEFSELVAADPVSASAEGVRVGYHHSCHMLRELGVREEPLDLLRRSGHEVVAWTGDDRCCGFGGLFSVKQPEISVAMADDKLDSLASSGAEMLVGCDQSCLLHLEGRMARRGETMPVRHLAEVLDEAMP
ncbi:MAG TPA: (Fe-S)-binding protein [Actinomycetota bacterium]|nr:(Fe-S)-binding protein [Actinomycetota bacterium]